MTDLRCRFRTPSRRFRAAAAAASSIAVACLSLGFGTTVARADFEQGYPGGCMIEMEVTPPNTCSYVNLGGDQETVVFEGTGTVSVTGCGGDLTTISPGAREQFINGQTPGATCSVTLNGTGLVAILDDNAPWGVCAGETSGFQTLSCTYTALTPFGVGLAEIVATSPTSASMTVTDNQTGQTFGPFPAVGVASLTIEGTWTSTVGHTYTVTVNTSGATAIAMAAGR